MTEISDAKFKEYLTTFGWMPIATKHGWCDETGYYFLIGFSDIQSGFKLILGVTNNKYYQYGCIHEMEITKSVVGTTQKCRKCNETLQYHGDD